MRQIKVELPKRTDKPSAKDIKNMREWVKAAVIQCDDWNACKKKRYVFTKKPRFCEECNSRLENRDRYQMRYGVCDQGCYMHLVGMSWSDFI